MKTLMKSHRATGAPTAIAAAVLAALMALAVTMAGTIAAPEDTQVILKCESGIPDAYTIETGHTLSSTVVGLYEAYSGDDGIATATNTGDIFNNLKITGKKAGVATIAYGTDLGVISVTRYQITDARNISSYIIKDSGAVRLANPGDSKPVPVEVVSGTDNIKWRSLNETVASVDPNTGLVTAAKKGVAILIGEFTDKWGVYRDIHILVGVGVSLDGVDSGTGGGGDDKSITATGAASVVDGRILDDAKTGDGEWVEIARNGDYSLIIRKDFIKCYQDQDQTEYWNWYAPQVNGNDYGTPTNFLRTEINKWFNMETNGNADGRQVLAKDARLRKFTVQNNAYNTLGSPCQYPASLADGFSRPTTYQTGEGNDVAFVLSWSEAACFCSIDSRYRDNKPAVINSGPIAAANYGKLSNLHAIYLRTAGETSDMMAIIFGGGSEDHGQVFQSNKAYIHPALWVHGSIFD